ncbi:hypothetical protein FNF27_03805 [Cafeteria roenbergensis]|uniref:Uncharacterized protein n=1 Tax=Cafeteria roenbergensis TaxID=33653 RepID=A0A5A8EAW3_CAFRO|nr:hypothetical protein FNF27_03805 [Cafeteria roenbergensis]
MSGRSSRAKPPLGGGERCAASSKRGRQLAAPQEQAGDSKTSNFQELLADVARTDILKREALDSVIDNSQGPLARGRASWLSSVTATFAGADTFAATDRDLASRQESLLAQSLPEDGEGFFVSDPIDVPVHVLERVVSAAEEWLSDADAALVDGDFASKRDLLAKARQAAEAGGPARALPSGAGPLSMLETAAAVAASCPWTPLPVGRAMCIRTVAAMVSSIDEATAAAAYRAAVAMLHPLRSPPPGAAMMRQGSAGGIFEQIWGPMGPLPGQAAAASTDRLGHVAAGRVEWVPRVCVWLAVLWLAGGRSRVFGACRGQGESGLQGRPVAVLSAEELDAGLRLGSELDSATGFGGEPGVDGGELCRAEGALRCVEEDDDDEHGSAGSAKEAELTPADEEDEDEDEEEDDEPAGPRAVHASPSRRAAPPGPSRPVERAAASVESTERLAAVLASGGLGAAAAALRPVDPAVYRLPHSLRDDQLVRLWAAVMREARAATGERSAAAATRDSTGCDGPASPATEVTVTLRNLGPGPRLMTRYLAECIRAVGRASTVPSAGGRAPSAQERRTAMQCYPSQDLELALHTSLRMLADPAVFCDTGLCDAVKDLADVCAGELYRREDQEIAETEEDEDDEDEGADEDAGGAPGGGAAVAGDSKPACGSTKDGAEADGDGGDVLLSRAAWLAEEWTQRQADRLAEVFGAPWPSVAEQALLENEARSAAGVLASALQSLRRPVAPSAHASPSLGALAPASPARGPQLPAAAGSLAAKRTQGHGSSVWLHSGRAGDEAISPLRLGQVLMVRRDAAAGTVVELLDPHGATQTNQWRRVVLTDWVPTRTVADSATGKVASRQAGFACVEPATGAVLGPLDLSGFLVRVLPTDAQLEAAAERALDAGRAVVPRMQEVALSSAGLAQPFALNLAKILERMPGSMPSASPASSHLRGALGFSLLHHTVLSGDNLQARQASRRAQQQVSEAVAELAALHRRHHEALSACPQTDGSVSESAAARAARRDVSAQTDALSELLRKACAQAGATWVRPSSLPPASGPKTLLSKAALVAGGPVALSQHLSTADAVHFRRLACLASFLDAAVVGTWRPDADAVADADPGAPWVESVKVPRCDGVAVLQARPRTAPSARFVADLNGLLERWRGEVVAYGSPPPPEAARAKAVIDSLIVRLSANLRDRGGASGR